MPLSFSVDHRRRRLRTRAYGSVSPADLAQFFSDRVSADVQGYDQIVDISEGTPTVQDADLRPLVNDRSASLAGTAAGRTAWVAPTEEQFARAEELKAKLAKLGVAVTVFRTTEEAEAWLDEAPPAT